MPKAYPKSIGACADLLFDLREKRLKLDKEAAKAKAAETALADHIINTLPKDSTGAAGKHHRVQVKLKEVPQVKDWPAFYAYVKKNNAFDLLQKRLSEGAVQERLVESKKGLPGVEIFKTPKVSLTKV